MKKRILVEIVVNLPRILISGFLICAGTSKLLEFEQFLQSLGALGVPMAIGMACCICAVEITLGISGLVDTKSKEVPILMTIFLLVFTFSSLASLLFGPGTAECNCFGGAAGSLLNASGSSRVVRNFLFLSLAICSVWLSFRSFEQRKDDGIEGWGSALKNRIFGNHPWLRS